LYEEFENEKKKGKTKTFQNGDLNTRFSDSDFYGR
jgi:hypothetical protein